MSKKHLHQSGSLTPAAKVGRRHSTTDMALLAQAFACVAQAQAVLQQLGAIEAAEPVEPNEVSSTETMDAGGDDVELTPQSEADGGVDEVMEAMVTENITINDPKKPLAETKPAPQVGKSINLNLGYAKSMHTLHDDLALSDLLSVKRVGTDTIKGYLALWGNPDSVDVENEFFTPQTDFWDDSMSGPRALTWDHALDPTMKADPKIGAIVEFGDDAVGRWYVGQLKRNHAYRDAIAKLIDQNAIGTSSDSAPQYVVRERTKSGAVWLKQWPLFAAALTTTPCEPRMLDAGSLVWKTVQQTLATSARMGAMEARLDNRNGNSHLETLRRRNQIERMKVEV